ncbi:alpha/beta hydrolase [Bordetella genomosp. 6]|uniref:alpha/beta hydrolase n=1 Tax=Bordetella genomosp. 6 TaxID=463024 RepID=UPI000A291E31|nr:alpha/beta hydrolase-fold protein [Bordetella genomosp. 6]ARP77306.1 ferric-enterobactin hydrolase [Bordetella genomosp. 6]
MATALLPGRAAPWLLAAALLPAASWAQPATTPDEPPERARARLGVLGLVQQTVLARGAGLRDVRLAVAVPAGQPPAAGWPVVYMLDGDAALQALALANRADLARQAVLVGIGYDSPGRIDGQARAWDYTPALPGTGAHGAPDPRNPQRRNGGAEAWLEFIETRVKPWVASAARIDAGRQTLYGHSYGGLFVLHTLLARPRAFQRYVAASPSLWWHAPYMMRRAADAGDFSHGAPVLHLMSGGAEVLRRPGAAPVATAGETARLAAILAGKAGLSVTLREFPGLSHGAMLPASAQAAVALAAQP